MSDNHCHLLAVMLLLPAAYINSVRYKLQIVKGWTGVIYILRTIIQYGQCYFLFISKSQDGFNECKKHCNTVNQFSHSNYEILSGEVFKDATECRPSVF